MRRASPVVALVATLAVRTLTASQSAEAPYCAVDTEGAAVNVLRPGPGEAPIDDVNWFARPVPNAAGHAVVAFASHNLNYLYDLTTGTRIRIPDRSDAVATPDGRYITVPSHYTKSFTVNFYDASVLLDRLAAGRDAADVAPVFEHRHADVEDVYYQSVGVVSRTGSGPDETIVYRMMFSGTTKPPMPGFRIVDYTFTRRNGALTISPSVPMRLCPQISRDLATPFISKDGRYVVAHDDSKEGRPASLKIFEILATDPATQSSTCAERVDLGFAAGKADFSYDNAQLTFHISKYDYLTAFVDGGLRAPAITDVVVVDLLRDAQGRLVGAGGMSRVTTSTTEGVGHYFPAFLPDGRVLFISNLSPRNSTDAKRFQFRVVDAARERRLTNLFAVPARRERAEAIGELWRQLCAPHLKPFRPQEAAWAFLSLSEPQCTQLVEERWLPASDARKPQLVETCRAR